MEQDRGGKGDTQIIAAKTFKEVPDILWSFSSLQNST